jgi:DNA-binding NarL/FixJ family response regulator/class 3 adenylate cyclase
VGAIANALILFTDLVDSTALTSELSHGDAERLRSSYFAALRGAIEDCGGTEVKNLGDGLMVALPSAVAALDCGAGMQRAMARYNRRAHASLAVRIGISAGDVTIENEDYFGECVVEASRLCAAAEGGQVLVTDVVRALARKSTHEFGQRYELALKGLPDPVAAWELVVRTDKVIGVAVIEDHPLYRQGLMQTIESTPGFDLIASAGGLKEMESLGYEGVEVALVDLHLPDGAGADVVDRVRAHGPSVLVVSASEDRQSVVDAIGAGASGYLPKSASAEEIAAATSVVAAGGSYVSPVLASFLLRSAREKDAEGGTALTSREREILSLLAEGETDSEIAERLFISISTVRSHLDRIRDKTGRRRRADLTRLALEHPPHD